MKLRVAAYALLLLAPLAGPAAAAPELGSFEYGPIGAPTGTGRVKIDVTLQVNGKPVTKSVTIPSGDIVAFKPIGGQLPNENIKDFAQRKADALADASQAKAKVIADAINTEFGLQGNAKVTVGLKAFKQTIFTPGQNVPDITSFYGSLVVPNVTKEQGNPVKFTENKVIGEGRGNGGRYLAPATPSPGGTRGSLQPVDPGQTVLGAGVDPLNDPSVVLFGLDDLFVAEVSPTPSMTIDDVLAALALQLNQHDEPAIFDQTTDTLFLVNPIPDGAQLDWGNTDVNFEFVTTFDPVPEPASLALLLGAVTAASLAAGIRGRVRSARMPAAR